MKQNLPRGRQHDEPHEVAEGVCERQYLRRPTTFRLAYSLTESPRIGGN